MGLVGVSAAGSRTEVRTRTPPARGSQAGTAVDAVDATFPLPLPAWWAHSRLDPEAVFVPRIPCSRGFLGAVGRRCRSYEEGIVAGVAHSSDRRSSLGTATLRASPSSEARGPLGWRPMEGLTDRKSTRLNS